MIPTIFHIRVSPFFTDMSILTNIPYFNSSRFISCKKPDIQYVRFIIILLIIQILLIALLGPETARNALNVLLLQDHEASLDRTALHLQQEFLLPPLHL